VANYNLPLDIQQYILAKVAAVAYGQVAVSVPRPGIDNQWRFKHTSVTDMRTHPTEGIWQQTRIAVAEVTVGIVEAQKSTSELQRDKLGAKVQKAK
jgi:hypothetical protein